MHLNEEQQDRVRQAIALIARTPGYETAATELWERLQQSHIRHAPRMDDRAQAGLNGTIWLGRESLEDHPLSLAETLIHELYHVHQNPFEKTISFWWGVFTGTPTMRRYEHPAYRAALDFLVSAARAMPELASVAEREQRAVAESFQAHYRFPLV